jgi:hypothetical protein
VESVTAAPVGRGAPRLPPEQLREAHYQAKAMRKKHPPIRYREIAAALGVGINKAWQLANTDAPAAKPTSRDTSRG